MSSSDRRKFAVRHPAVVDMGCSCRRPRLLPSFMPSSSLPKDNPSRTLSAFSPTTSANTTTTTTTTATSSLWEASLTASATTPTTASSPFRYYDYISSSAVSTPQSLSSATTKTTRGHEKIEEDKEKKKNKKNKKKGVVEESVAVVKESSDPYADFRDSMLQMILEMDIYAWDDLRDLLHRFLALNSPRHHHLIFCAFAEIWRALFSVHSSSLTPSSPGASAASSSSSSLGGRRL